MVPFDSPLFYIGKNNKILTVRVALPTAGREARIVKLKMTFAVVEARIETRE